jgi:hypothetical protein
MKSSNLIRWGWRISRTSWKHEARIFPASRSFRSSLIHPTVPGGLVTQRRRRGVLRSSHVRHFPELPSNTLCIHDGRSAERSPTIAKKVQSVVRGTGAATSIGGIG